MAYAEAVNRDHLAAAILALGAIALLALAWWYAEPSTLDLVAALHAVGAIVVASLHGALAVGVLRGAAAPRWIAMGLAFFWALFGLVAAPSSAHDAVRAGIVLLHAPLPLLLARPDPTHPRTSLSLMLAGGAVVPALLLGAATAHLTATLAIAGGLAVIGVCGLARERTWGLLLVGGAGLAFLAPTPAVSASCAAPHASLIGLMLVAVAAPFAAPIARWLRG